MLSCRVFRAAIRDFVGFILLLKRKQQQTDNNTWSKFAWVVTRMLAYFFGSW